MQRDRASHLGQACVQVLWPGAGPGRQHPRPRPRGPVLHPCGFPTQVAAAGGPAGTEDPGAPPPQVPSVQQLQRKLKEAARVALRLQLEKEQLLELGNRLRAELGRPAGEPSVLGVVGPGGRTAAPLWADVGPEMWGIEPCVQRDFVNLLSGHHCEKCCLRCWRGVQAGGTSHHSCQGPAALCQPGAGDCATTPQPCLHGHCFGRKAVALLFLVVNTYVFVFRERGREGERGEHQCVVASVRPLLGT